MTCEEFFREFNILYNNVTSNQAPGLNEFEISTFLTMAEEQMVEETYGGRIFNDGFEKTEEVREYLRSLNDRKIIPYSEFVPDDPSIQDFGYNCYQIKVTKTTTDTPPKTIDDVLFITMEHITASINNKNKFIQVIPIKYDDFLRTYKNPFRGIRKHRCLRIDKDNNYIYLYTDTSVTPSAYVMDFVRKPKPIIIGNTAFSSLTINGVNCGTDCECEMPEITHRPILLKAVQIAKSVWQSK